MTIMIGFSNPVPNMVLLLRLGAARAMECLRRGFGRMIRPGLRGLETALCGFLSRDVFILTEYIFLSNNDLAIYHIFLILSIVNE